MHGEAPEKSNILEFPKDPEQKSHEQSLADLPHHDLNVDFEHLKGLRAERDKLQISEIRDRLLGNKMLGKWGEEHAARHKRLMEVKAEIAILEPRVKTAKATQQTLDSHRMDKAA